MKRIILGLILCVLVAGLRAPLAVVPGDSYVPASGPGPHAVQEWTAEWTDPSRGRVVPVRIYYPADAKSPCPVVVFSHGLGGSRDGYRYLGERWASRGYVSVHVQHLGSDSALLKDKHPVMAFVKSAQDPENARNRPLDITFALDMLARLNGEEGFPLKGRLDMARVGVGGHSFGAYTALASAGRVFSLPGGTWDPRDPRVKACVALSAPVRSKAQDCPTYHEFAVPCLHMTGTKDVSPIGGTPAVLRRVPYDCIPAPDQYLAIFEGGDHMVFSGRISRRPKSTDARFQQLVCEATTAFWDAYLRGDEKAKSWLARGGFERDMGASGTFEEKRVSP